MEQEFDGLKEKFISKKYAKVGRIYLMSSGRLLVYLGQEQTTNRYVFYVLCFLHLESTTNKIKIVNYAVQRKYIDELIKEVMQAQAEPMSLLKFSSWPNILAIYDVSFESSYVQSWINKNRLLGIIDTDIISSKASINTLFVKSRDLIPGHIYYSGDGWRNLFVYLGRTKEKEFRWYFIGDLDILYKSSKEELYAWSYTTKTNKKVKDIFNYKRDTYVCDTVKKLADKGYIKEL